MREVVIQPDENGWRVFLRDVEEEHELDLRDFTDENVQGAIEYAITRLKKANASRL